MTRLCSFRVWCQLALASAAAVSFARAGDDHFAPTAPEFQVNQYAKYAQSEPAIAADRDGNFVVVWTSLGDIWARMYWQDGTPRTSEFNVNPTLTHGDQDYPSIGMSPSGAFVIAWQDWDGNDGYQMGGGARVYFADGTPRTGEFILNSHWQGSQFDQAIAMAADGSFVAAWSDSDRDGIAGVYARMFGADGTPRGDEFLANDPQSTSQVTPGIATNSAGDFVVSWTDASAHYGEPRNVVARVYRKDGTPLTAEIPLTGQNGAGFQRWPTVAMAASGNWMAVWQDESAADGDGHGCFGCLFDLAGQPLTPVFQINQTTAGNQDVPRVAADFFGNLLVVWQDASSGSLDAKARRFDATGAPLGDEFLVNSITQGDQLRPWSATDCSGERRFIAFMGDGDIWVRAYHAAPITADVHRNAQGDLEVGIDLALNGNPSFPYQIGISAGTTLASGCPMVASGRSTTTRTSSARWRRRTARCSSASSARSTRAPRRAPASSCAG
ncbi:MAG: hypothetical protein U1E76_05905 [Planctomycetota bacterium]